MEDLLPWLQLICFRCSLICDKEAVEFVIPEGYCVDMKHIVQLNLKHCPINPYVSVFHQFVPNIII